MIKYIVMHCSMHVQYIVHSVYFNIKGRIHTKNSMVTSSIILFTVTRSFATQLPIMVARRSVVASMLRICSSTKRIRVQRFLVCFHVWWPSRIFTVLGAGSVKLDNQGRTSEQENDGPQHGSSFSVNRPNEGFEWARSIFHEFIASQQAEQRLLVKYAITANYFQRIIKI